MTILAVKEKGVNPRHSTNTDIPMQLLHFFCDAGFSFGENFDSIDCKTAQTCDILWKPFRLVRFDSRSENKLYELFCSYPISAEPAQQEIAHSWIAAYEKYIGPLPGENEGQSLPDDSFNFG